jgi:hypothetical protein
MYFIVLSGIKRMFFRSAKVYKLLLHIILLEKKKRGYGTYGMLIRVFVS